MAATLIPSASATGLQFYRQTFTSSGTWTKPTGVTTVRVRAAGGGGGAFNIGTGGAGGGAGGYIDTEVNVTSISTATVTIGAGGASSTTSTSITDGGTTSFGSLVYAYGGQSYSTKWQANSSVGMVLCDSGQAENMQQAAGGLANVKWIETYGSLQTLTSNTHVIGPNASAQTAQQVIAYGNGVFVAINRQVAGQTYTSSDGFTWTLNSAVFTGTAQHISFNGTYFVIVINATGTSAYYSSNGVSWTATGALPTSQTWWGAVGGTGITVAYASGTAAAAYSTTGTSWTSFSLPIVPNAGFVLNYVNGTFLLTNNTTAIYKSTNGYTWTSAGTLGASMAAQSATYGNSLYMIFNPYTATYYTSPDLATWTSRTLVLNGPTSIIGSYSSYSAPTFIGNRWVLMAGIAGSGPTARFDIWTSTDGINWSLVRTWTKGSVYASTYTPVASLTQDVFQLSTGRYVVGYWDNTSSLNGTPYYRSAIYQFSDYLIGGFSGIAIGYNTASSSSPGTGNGSAGAFSSVGTSIQTYTTNGSTGALLTLGGLGSPEGWCIGGNGYLQSPIGTPGSGLFYYGVNLSPLSYGSGAHNFTSLSYGGINGAPGIVVVEWWN